LGLGLFACAVVNDKVYIFGGLGADGGTAVGEYDPAADSWQVKAPMPRGRFSYATIVDNGLIYLLGGCPDNSSFACTNTIGAIDVYDPAQDSWRTLPELMLTPRFSLAAVLFNGNIFALGGSSDTPAPLRTIDEYNIATMTWESHLPMPFGQRDFGLNVVDGKMYIIGSVVYEYTP
jgi:N-acetylneuraminic acid mutarotase